jgi:hypothetical protein
MNIKLQGASNPRWRTGTSHAPSGRDCEPFDGIASPTRFGASSETRRTFLNCLVRRRRIEQINVEEALANDWPDQG